MDVFSEKVSSLPSAQRSYTSELSWYPVFRSSESSESSGLRRVRCSVFGVVSELKELSSYPRNGRKGTRSSPVTRIAAVMMAAELL
jgi:hypothetical protein